MSKSQAFFKKLLTSPVCVFWQGPNKQSTREWNSGVKNALDHDRIIKYIQHKQVAKHKEIGLNTAII